MYQRILIFKILITGLWLSSLWSCSPGGSKELDPIFGGVTIGDSAFTSTPSSLDFGNVALSSHSTKTITIKNSSEADIYISTINTNSAAYQVISENCPHAPNVINAQKTCDLTIQFSPSTSGLVGAAIGIRYGISNATSSQYVTNFGLSGRGISPLVFAGLQSIDQPTNKSMRLNWTPNVDATSFIIFRMVAGSMVFEKTVVNASGTLANDVVTGLLPSTSYTWRVRAVDVFGASDTNTVDITSSTSVNQLPLLAAPGAQTLYQAVAWSLNLQDSNTGNDTDIDTDPLTYSCYYDLTVNGVVGTATTCASLVNEDSSPATFNAATGVFNWTPPFAVTPGTQYEIRVTANDPYGGSSSQIFVATVNSGVPILSYTPTGHFVFPSTFISSTSPLSLNFYNNRTGNDTGVSSYACVFDRVIDGAMSAPANCSTLPGTASFNTTTGVLNWTPTTTTWGPYELHVTATNAAGSDAVYVKVNVEAGLHKTNLLSYWDASFADGEKFGLNAPLLTQWKDLTTAGTARDGVLSNFVGNITSGWNNTNIPALAFDGVNNQVSFGTLLNPLVNFALDTWVQPKNYVSSVIFSNADNGGLGLTLKQSSAETGKLVLVAGENSFEDEILLDSPAGYWRFNEPVGLTAYDISGNGKHATYTASVTRGQSGGIADGDSAVLLNGTTGSMNAPLAIGITTTIEVWAQTTNLASTPMLWRTGPNNVGPDMFFYNNKISLNTWDGDANPLCILPVSAADGNFHQYVITIDSVGNQARLYYDGALCGTAAYRNPTAPSITFSSGLGSYEWNGKIDEAAVYHTILSPTRILAHYNAKMRATCRSSMAVNPNQWTHIFAGYTDATKTLNMWVNGKNQCSVAHPTTLAGSTQAFVAGRSPSNALAWQGLMGEMRSYTAATNTPATTNFNNLKGKYDQHVPLQNMRLWLRSDTFNYLADGTLINFWKDTSGVNNHALQFAGSDQPQYSSTALSGRPGLIFNNHCFVTQTPEALTDFTFFVVYKDDGILNNYERLLDKDYTNGFWLGRDDATANTLRMGIMQSAAPYGMPSSFFSDISPHIVTATRAGTTHTLYSDGANAVSQTAPAGATSSSSYGIGCWYNGNGAQRFGGVISEVIVYSSALSTADRQRVERYLGDKYSITVP